MKVNFLLFFFFLSTAISWGQENTLQVGEMAPPIHLKTAEGEDFTLQSLEGKVVLIDFWATWCAPCIKEQPELIELYTKIRAKEGGEKFEILGVSLDREKKDWLAGIAKFEIPWTQVSDLKFWRSQVANDYKLQGIPFNVIIDETGKIIALNLHEEELENFLFQAVFNKN